MDTSTSHDHPDTPRRFNAFPWVLCGLLLIIAFFLFTGHSAHVFGILPWLLILACPFMHLFMHGSHGHGHGEEHDGSAESDRKLPPEGGHNHGH